MPLPSTRTWLAVATLLALPALLGSPAGERIDAAPQKPVARPGSTAAAQCDVTLARRVFGQCAICHGLEPGEPALAGPNLHGVVGRVAGADPGFGGYSMAMRKWGGRWTVEELDRFLTDPVAHVPGTSMAFAGLKKPEERAAVICYLQQAAAAPRR